MRDFPERQIRVLYGSGRNAINDKVAKLVRLVNEARNEVLVITTATFASSQTICAPSWLLCAIASRRSNLSLRFPPRTGLHATSPVHRHVLRFLSWSSGCSQLDGIKFTLGPTIVTTRAHLAGFGGYQAIENKPASLRAGAELTSGPWTIKIDGMVEKPMEVGIDDLVRKLTLEERTYRHRCVEAWSMAIAWTGFPLPSWWIFARPLVRRNTSRCKPSRIPRRRPAAAGLVPWPYIEGLTMAEATTNSPSSPPAPMAIRWPSKHGAPLRLAVPWKYGFKSIKSIVRFTFTDKRPRACGRRCQSSEYGFWANVNPAVPHPRWSQASEEVIGTGERRPTLISTLWRIRRRLYKGLKPNGLWA